MTPPTFIINDSEGESDGGFIDESVIQPQPAPVVSDAPIHPAPFYETNGYQTVPASGELRKKAIDEAHAALLSTTPVSPTQVDPSNPALEARRRQTANGRLEGGEQDIYAFNASEENDDFRPDPENKKRKRPASEKKAPRTKQTDDSDGYGESTKSNKKKPTKRAKSTGGGMSVLDLLNDTSEDDWRPNASKLPSSGKKSTRNNTVDTELLPPLPKPKRKPRESAKTTSYYDPQQFDGNITLNFNHSEYPSNTHNTEIQVAATRPTPQAVASTFMIDLTHNELVLPHERRAEYDTLSPELSPAESPRRLPATNFGGVYDTPDLRSTIPDPPYDSNFLPSQLATHLAESHTHVPEFHPLAPPSVASDSPLSSLENSPAAKPIKKPKEIKRAATDQHLGLSLSEEGDNGFGNFPVASEWRAAKGKARQGMAQATYAGRAKTSNAVDLLAASGGRGSDDDDVWTGDGKVTQKKKKSAAKKRKGTANDNGDISGVMQNAKSKRRKSKPIETLVIGSEDELSGGSRGKGHDLLGSVQVSATASLENFPSITVEKQMDARPNIKQKIQTPKDGSYDTIAVNNSIPPATGPEQLAPEESKPPGLGAGTKKVHRWGRPKFLDEPVEGSAFLASEAVGGSTSTITVPHVSPIPIKQVQELSAESTKVTKRETAAAKRRKSKEEEEEEEDWTGDPEPARKPATKKEPKPKTPRITKKAAATAAKEAKEKEEKEEKEPLSSETIKISDDGDDDDLASAIALEPEPAPVKKASSKKEAKPKISKAAAKKSAKVITTSKETVSDTDDGDEKRETVTPAPEPKPETKMENPQTPSKELAEKIKKTPHSPISKGPVKFRVGLSRRAHIEPLLKIIRK